MAEHVGHFSGLASGNLISPDRTRAHELAVEDCELAAVTHAVHDLWDRYQRPINLVFGKQRHFAEHGDSKLTDLLATLANCDKARSVSVYARCKATYEGL